MGQRQSYGKSSNADGGNSSVLKSRCSRIAIIVSVCVLLVNLFLYSSGLLWKGKCYVAFLRSGFDFLDTDNYELWYGPNSTMQLAQSGTFKGPSQMTEYVDFTRAIYFSFYGRLKMAKRIITATQDQCLLQVAVQNKAQVKPEYSQSGEGVCIITTVGFKLNYTMGLFGSGFQIQQMDLFYPDQFLVELFNNTIGGEGTTDYICDKVLRDNCPEVYEANGLDEETCKTMYNALPGVDNYGYLDDKKKGCRILHSAFAEVNEKHCPHMSFKPIEDYSGTIWCQKSGGVKAEDLFTEDELTFIKDFAIDSGFDPVTLSTTCDYDASISGWAKLGGHAELRNYLGIVQ